MNIVTYTGILDPYSSSSSSVPLLARDKTSSMMPPIDIQTISLETLDEPIQPLVIEHTTCPVVETLIT